MILDPNFILKVGLALLTAAVLAFAVTPLVKKLAQKVGAIDVPTDGRRMHHTPIPRMGGLAIFIAFLIFPRLTHCLTVTVSVFVDSAYSSTENCRTGLFINLKDSSISRRMFLSSSSSFAICFIYKAALILVIENV